MRTFIFVILVKRKIIYIYYFTFCNKEQDGEIIIVWDTMIITRKWNPAIILNECIV